MWLKADGDGSVLREKNILTLRLWRFPTEDGEEREEWANQGTPLVAAAQPERQSISLARALRLFFVLC